MTAESDPETSASETEDRIGMHITSGPEHSDIEATPAAGASEPDLPFRLLLVSDLRPRAEVDWAERDARRAVDASTRAADLMAEWSPTLSLEVSNTIGKRPDTWTVELSFPTPESFAPEAVARQLAPLARLLDLRSLVTSAAEGDHSVQEFEEELAALGVEIDWADELYRLLTGEGASRLGGSGGETSDSSSGEDALGRVMEMVNVDDGGDSAPANASEEPGLPDDLNADSRMASALAAAVEHGGTNGATAAEYIPRRLTTVLRTQVRQVIEHPAFRRLEAAWRGLFFLEERLSFKNGVELVVLPAGRDDLHEALHHQVLMPEHSDSYDEPPTSLVMVDHSFGRTHAEVEQLADLAGTGESLQAPVVASVDADFFGVEHLRGLSKLPSLRSHLQGDEYVEWKSFRRKDVASFLGLTLPSVRLRSPYGTMDTDLDLGIEEEEGLYGSGALVVGAAAGQSLVETGWPTHLSEPSISVSPAVREDERARPLAVEFSGSMQSELARAGFVVLDRRDVAPGQVCVSQAPSTHNPGVYEEPSAAAEARAEALLACRLFAARAAHRLLAIERTLDLSASLDDIRTEVATAMTAFLGVSSDDLSRVTGEETVRPSSDSSSEEEAESGEPPCVRVNHVTDADVPNQEVLAVRLRPPEEVLSTDARLAMTLRLPQSS